MVQGLSRPGYFESETEDEMNCQSELPSVIFHSYHRRPAPETPTVFPVTTAEV
jgi:hypothetical protein